MTAMAVLLPPRSTTDSPSSAKGMRPARREGIAPLTCTTVRAARSSLETGPVSGDEPRVVDRAHLPARLVHAAAPSGVVEHAGHVHVGVAGVGQHRDVPARARCPPA